MNDSKSPKAKSNWLILCNAQSLFYKLDELRALSVSLRPLFICVTETWLTPDIVSDLISIQNYCIFRNDRRDNPSDDRRGGGTLVYAASSTSSVHVDTHLVKPNGIECNLIKFTDPSSVLCYLLCIYVPPGLRSEIFHSIKVYIIDTFDFVLNCTPNAEIFVCGDLNRYDFSFLTQHFNICNIVNEPTFGNAILDKIYCNEHFFDNFDVLTAPPLGFATNLHKIVIVSRTANVRTDETQIQKVFDFRDSNIDAFLRTLDTSDWSKIFMSNDVKTSVKHFYDIFYHAMSKIPVTFVKINGKTKPWITPITLDLINKRWRAYREGNFPLYRHYKAKVTAEISKSKKIWSSKMCKTFQGVWSVVNDIRGKKSKNSTSQISALFSNTTEAVESINALFSSYFTSSSAVPAIPVNTSDDIVLCSSGDLFSCLSHLRTDKSPGSDGIHPLLLKLSASQICEPLAYIFNQSFRYGTVPEVWKIANVCPIPKTSPIKKDLLRPISLLPIASKIFENVVLNIYRDAFVNCYDPFQFAYRPRSSTVCALITIHDFILKTLELPNVSSIRILTFDMSHAFDCVPHDLLLTCIRNLPVPLRNCNYLLNWLNGYLCNRQQRVKLGETFSSLVHVSSGVPQGSLLGPYLFALYFSSYQPLDNKVNLVKYADDITLLVPVFKDDADDLSIFSSEVNHFRSWCYDHRMLINDNKTKVLSVNFSCSPLQNVYDSESVLCVKILGLFFNRTLTWSHHFQNIATSVSKRLYVLRVLKPILGHDQLILVFNCIVRSLIEYGSAVFINPGSVLNNKLEILCKRAFRIIHGLKIRSCDKCEMLNVGERRKMLAMRLFRQVVNDSKHVLHRLLPPQSERSKRFILPQVKTDRRLRGFVLSCAMMHNDSH